MQPPLGPDASLDDVMVPAPGRTFASRALTILWPAFVMAGVLEMLVFVVVDPGSLQWWGVQPVGWSNSAVYSATFFIFWGVISTSAAISHLLEAPGQV